MITPSSLHPRRQARRAALAATAAILCGVLPALGEGEIYHPRHAVHGGLDPRPFITSVARTGDVATVNWEGFNGPFQLFQSTSLGSTQWQALGDPVQALAMSLSVTGEMGFLKISAPEPFYVGITNSEISCALCHRSVYTNWIQTAHSHAFQTLKDIGTDKSPSCLPCHTVGYGFATGFKDEATTPHLAGVQCENCHGPAGYHLTNFEDESLRPVVTPAAAACGGCHTDFHHPTYDEWLSSAHAEITGEVGESIEAQGNARMLACGPCHAGAVRLALLDQLSVTNTSRLRLPLPEDGGGFGVTCAVCHTAHRQTEYGSQLRNPRYSTNNFSYSTSTNTSFALQYRENIQVCGQCHNLRGGRYQDTSRPPHHSPQYNVLIGQGGYDAGQGVLAAHGRSIVNQCAHCHTHPHEVSEPSEDTPNFTGHGFEAWIGENCAECHDSVEVASSLMTSTQSFIRDRIEEVKELLDSWATNNAPVPLREKYGRFAWEYNNPGELSLAPGSTNKGPTTAEQPAIPDRIKQARFNLYVVENDGSFGVHNGTYARKLLSIAEDNIRQEMQPLEAGSSRSGPGTTGALAP